MRLEYNKPGIYQFEEIFHSKRIYEFASASRDVAIEHDSLDRSFLLLEIIPRAEETVENQNDKNMYRVFCVEIITEEGKKVRMNNGKKYKAVHLLDYLAEYERFRKYEELTDVKSDEVMLRERIHDFVNRKNAYRDFDREVNEHILGQPNLSRITYNVFMWLRALAEGSDMKNNALIAAPSGCGKTETYRVIRKILEREIGKIPVIQLDSTQLTMEGFSGKNTDEFLEPLFSESVNGIAIVVLDEIDKRLMPSYASDGKNVNAEIQSQILTVIEGTKLTCKRLNKSIHTKNTLFIAAGAFQAIRDERMECKQQEQKPRKMGFQVDNIEETQQQKDSDEDIKREDITMEDITVEDIIQHGGMYEFIGRFSTIINLYKLNRKSVAVIARRYAKQMEKNMKCRITLTEEAIDQLYEVYSDSGFGCRILYSTMWNRLSLTGLEMEREGIIHKNAQVNIIYDAKDITYHQMPANKEAVIAV